ncbi:MAG: hypothetical protein K9L30_11825 [Desulfobacterales bacterium]|nr:hypothetical protein [Desulfobacterales bacterium]
MTVRKYILFMLIFMPAVLTGCQAVMHRSDVDSELKRNIDFFNNLDNVIQKAGVKDTATFPVKGFPYLRTSRFVAEIASLVETEEQKSAIVDYMMGLDAAARDKEVANLFNPGIKAVAVQQDNKFSQDDLKKQIYRGAEILHKYDKVQPGFYENVFKSVTVPDEYSTILRTAGVYPITVLPVIYLTKKTRNEFSIWHETSPDRLTIDGKLTAYSLAETTSYDRGVVGEILKDSIGNTLRIPTLSEENEMTLISMFAPVFVMDVAAHYDQIGGFIWKDGQVATEEQNPSVYYYISHALFKDRPVIQLNYVVWFSGRSGENSPWIERGNIDGMTVRITLDTEGIPFMVDIMNNCGCYHFFVPNRDYVQDIVTRPSKMDPFYPEWLPTEFPEKRLQLRINSGWHQVQHIAAIDNSEETVICDLVNYDELEMLPDKKGDTKSIFNEKGIIKESRRIEPVLLFSMGVHSIGSMRQRGHHATSLIGRDHFDDPCFLEKSFIFK